MKKRSIFILSILSILILTSCSGNSGGDSTTLKIGVSPEPHRDIVEFIKDDLKEEGINLEIIEFNDYIIPNKALDSGEIDLNFFQHLPYLESFIVEEELDLTSIGGVHIEPIALYSNSFKSLDEIDEGAEIAIPNDPVNGGRALILLEQNGLIKLKDGAGLEATELDIEDNPKNLSFKALEAATLPRVLDDVDGAVINGNYALESGLNPLKDGIIIEDKDSPYVNIVAVRKGEEEKEDILKVINALNSDKLKDFLLDNYDGAVVPAF